jgi:methylmalonyl-CoA/ethylmalonyl-CoA epimerase
VLQTALLSNVVFDHIAVGVHRIDDALPFLIGELGGRAAGGGAAPSFLFRQWTFGGGKLEVLEPAGPPGGFLHRFLDRRGPGVHHVTFLVPALDVACAQAAALGFLVVGRDDSDPDWKEAFLHPKQAQSIVVQLVERGLPADGVPPAPEVHKAVPGDPESGPLGIDLVGLRLAAHDLERAQSLWCGLLAGIGRWLDDELEVRWPGSIMRLLVRRAGSPLEEGPLAIEIGCLRPAVVPRGSHPVLGVVFAPVDITELPPPPDEGDLAIASGAPAGDDTGGDAVDDEDGVYFLDGDAIAASEDEPS